MLGWFSQAHFTRWGEGCNAHLKERKVESRLGDEGTNNE